MRPGTCFFEEQTFNKAFSFLWWVFVAVCRLLLWQAGLVAPKHMGSWFPNQGLNPCPLHLKTNS